jgi:hypothetical protein
VLNSFTIRINDHGSGQLFIGYVYRWNSTTGMAVGPALYTSSVVNLAGQTNYQTASFSTGGVNLTHGNQ